MEALGGRWVVVGWSLSGRWGVVEGSLGGRPEQSVHILSSPPSFDNFGFTQLDRRAKDLRSLDNI